MQNYDKMASFSYRLSPSVTLLFHRDFVCHPNLNIHDHIIAIKGFVLSTYMYPEMI